MINEELINPKSIVVVGGSSTTAKPGGNCIHHLLSGNYQGELYAVNPKEDEVLGIKSYRNIHDIPQTDLAVIAIPVQACLEAVTILAEEKGVKAFIIFAAGFSEVSMAGAELEQKIVNVVNNAGASLIGPNCIGMMNSHHRSIFILPPNIPIDPFGVDLISTSGGTAIYTVELGMRMGLRYSSIWSIGNGLQTRIEDVLEYMDVNFDPGRDSLVKLLYIESIKDPDKLLKHASSLIRKGCRIAAIKSGSSEFGSRAAFFHTAAEADLDSAVDALFRKAGIVRCYSREELITVGAVFNLKKLKGKRLAIITQAGGPAVILTDRLVKLGMEIPNLINLPEAEELKTHLLPGSSTANPIDILGTGNSKHLAVSINYCEEKFEDVDGMVVIFGSHGLSKVYDAYDILDQKMRDCKKPIFPIMPTIHTAWDETSYFIDKRNVNFNDEVVLATALDRILKTPDPFDANCNLEEINVSKIRKIIESLPSTGSIASCHVRELFDVASILMGKELSSEMKDGIKFFIKAEHEPKFGAILHCGFSGGIIDLQEKDVVSGLAPLSKDEALFMIRSLKGYKIFQTLFDPKGNNEFEFAETIVRLSALLQSAKEIKELEINLSSDSLEVFQIIAKLYIFVEK